MENTRSLYFFLFIALALAYVSAPAASDGSGLKTSVGLDVVGQAGLNSTSGASDRLDVREFEVMLYAPADHLFDGMGSIAAHYEGTGIPQVELHEAYLGSSKLIPRSRFRAGQYFLGIGRLNQVHRHDWPFISAPKVHKEFFDAEALLDTGIEYSYLLPIPHFLEVTAGVTNGFVYGHDHSAGSRPLVPTNYLRTVTYFSLPWDGGTQIGLNYLGRRGGEGTQRTILGVDLTAKWKEGALLNFLLQSEIWYRVLTPKGGTTQKAFGLYLYPQYYLGENLFLGLRVDYYSVLNLTDAFGSPVKSVELNFVPTVTYRPSEFSSIRLAYNLKPEFQGGASTTGHHLELQGVIVLGAHPAHDF